MPPTLDQIRNTRPITAEHLWNWVYAYTGIRMATEAVCPGHQAPFEAFASWQLNPANLTLMLGPRGGGKSFLSAIDTHLRSRFHPRHGTRILGGSKAQSEQIYDALSEVIRDGRGKLGNDAAALAKLLKTQATYKNGSSVTILAASPTSVRGPHVPSLKLDEVDEIDPDVRESAMGMAMEKNGVKSSVLMTSTWHRVGGPMAGLIDRANNGDFPLHSFCMFEVLERCPEERSGRMFEKCPECPLMPWCHEGREQHPTGLPKAKRSSGHYAIDSAIQKVQGVSLRAFEADFLCKGPKADGLWFTQFDTNQNQTRDAEYDPSLPVHLSIDSGVFTGAVFFQVKERPRPTPPLITVFADYLAENVTAESNARALKELAAKRCNGNLQRVSTDPAGGSRNPIGPTVIAEYERAGLRGRMGMEKWPIGSISDALTLVEGIICSADGTRSLLVHPRCKDTLVALSHYRRAKRGGQWMDYPEDPQHPFEDLVDALKGGLKREFPDGLAFRREFRSANVNRLRY